MVERGGINFFNSKDSLTALITNLTISDSKGELISNYLDQPYVSAFYLLNGSVDLRNSEFSGISGINGNTLFKLPVFNPL